MQVQDQIAPLDSLKPDCSETALEEIRQCVANGYLAVGHGGLEVGGVLLGRMRGEGLRIEASQPLISEHAFGPSLRLSPVDEEALCLQISLTGLKFPGLEPVGWYRSYTRSEAAVTASDLAILDRYFPGPGRVLLLLEPVSHHKVSASFFVRGEGGNLDLCPVGETLLLRPRLDFTPRSSVEHSHIPTQASSSGFEASPPSQATSPVQNQPSLRTRWPLLISLMSAAIFGLAILAALAWPRIGPVEAVKIVIPPAALAPASNSGVTPQERNFNLEKQVAELTARNNRLEATLTILRKRSQPRAAVQKKPARRRGRR